MGSFGGVLAAAIITAVATVGLAVLAYFQIRAGSAQAAATLEIARETREAAVRQWQPRVFARKWGPPERGNGNNAGPDEMAVSCYLVNEGTGPAFNIELGVEVAGKLHRWKTGQWWAMRAGEFMPQLEPDSKQPVPSRPLCYVPVKQSEWDEASLVYWTQFENLLSERIVVRTYPDLMRPADVQVLS